MLASHPTRRSPDQWLIVRVGAHLCALALDDVEETMRPQRVTPVAGTPPSISGAALIRGTPVPVVDAATLLGEAAAPPRRLVTLKTADRRVALAVDEVVGVRSLAAASASPMPPLLRGVNEDVISTIRATDGALLLVLDGARLISPAVWAAIDEQG